MPPFVATAVELDSRRREDDRDVRLTVAKNLDQVRSLSSVAQTS